MIYFGLIIIGLCFGSFVNALVWRLHEQQKTKKNDARDLSIVHGRSICTECSHSLAAKDLIPVISWVILSGKCRYCHKKISWQYPLVEIVTTILFTISYIAIKPTTGQQYAAFVVLLLSITIGVALAVYDFRWMILPDSLVKVFLLFATIFFLLSNYSSINSNTVVNLIGSVVVAGGIFYLIYQVSGGKWIGGGDVKMGFVLGIFLANASSSFMMLFLASILGLIFAGGMAIVGKYNAKVQIPFGPFLLLATYLTMLYGSVVIEWYKNIVLI